MKKKKKKRKTLAMGVFFMKLLEMFSVIVRRRPKYLRSGLGFTRIVFVPNFIV